MHVASDDSIWIAAQEAERPSGLSFDMTNLLAVGEVASTAGNPSQGAIWQCNPSGCNRRVIIPGKEVPQITAMIGTSPNNLWIMGPEGTGEKFIGRCNETSCREVTHDASTDSILRAIWAINDDLVYVVGQRNLFLRCSGNTCTRMTPGNWDLTGIGGLTKSHYFITGFGGYLRECYRVGDVDHCTDLKIFTRRRIEGLFIPDQNTAWIMGEVGTLLRYYPELRSSEP